MKQLGEECGWRRWLWVKEMIVGEGVECEKMRDENCKWKDLSSLNLSL